MTSKAKVVDKNDKDKIFKILSTRPENQSCFGCGGKDSQWTSSTYGIFICYSCSSLHRSMGTHISFVRSTGFDEWTTKQIAMMILGGNARARSFFRDRGVSDNTPQKTLFESKAADMYRQVLEKAVSEVDDLDKLIKNLLESKSTDSESGWDVSKNTSAKANQKQDNSIYGRGMNKQKAETRGVQRVGNNFFDDFSDDEEAPDPAPSKGYNSSAGETRSGRLEFNEKELPKQQQNPVSRQPGQQPGQQPRQQQRAQEVQKPEGARNNPATADAYKHSLFDDEDNNTKSKSKVLKGFDNEWDKFDNEDFGGRYNHNKPNRMYDDGYRGGEESSYGKVTSSRGYDDGWSKGGSDEYNNDRFSNDWRGNGRSRDDRSGNYNSSKGFDDWEDRPVRSQIPSSTKESDYAQKKFSNAKSISSDQYFGSDTSSSDYGRASNINRFSNAQAISSADYYGRDESDMGSRSNNNSSLNNIARSIIESTGADFDTIKDTVYQKSTQIAGVAREWMETLQDRYS